MGLMYAFSTANTSAPPPAGDSITSLLATMAPGEWKRLGPNLTTQPGSLNDVEAPRTKAVFDVGGASGSLFATDSDVVAVCKHMLPSGFPAWNGAAVGTGSYKNKLYYWGAGHADGAGNQAFRFDLGDASASILAAGGGGEWEAITDQNPLGGTQSPDYPVEGGGQSYFYYPTQPGQNVLQPVGSKGPSAGHSYDLDLFDGVNKRLWIAPTAIFQQSGSGGALWYLDLVIGEWVIHDTAVTIAPNASMLIAPNFAGDKLFWQIGTSGAVIRYDIANKTQETAAVFWSGPGGSQMPKIIVPSLTGVSGEYDLIAFPNTAAGGLTVFPSIINGINGASFGITTLNGVAPAYGVGSCGRIRTVDGKCYVLTGPSGSIQTISFDDGNSSVTIADVAVSNAPVGLSMTNGINGKFQYMPDYDAFVTILGDDTAEVWLLKPPAAA